MTRKLVLRFLAAASISVAWGGNAVAQPSVVGQWGATIPTTVAGIHAVLLPTGKVLYWGYPDAAPGSESAFYDPETNSFVYTAFPRNLFCAGASLLPDGRLYLTGGDVQPPFCPENGQGLPVTHVYDPFIDWWLQLQNMVTARWYPTNVPLGDGSVIIMAGLDSVCNFTEVMEKFSGGTLSVIPQGQILFDLYPRLFLMTDGRIFHAGPDYKSYVFRPFAPIGWTEVGDHPRGSRFEAPCIEIPNERNKYLYFGGYTEPTPHVTNTVERIDMNVASPMWTLNSASMNYARFHCNAVVLPDGKVMVVGGGLTDNYQDPVLIPEMYDPVANTFMDLPPLTYGRMYHSTAILLPDARVLVSGQDDGPSANYNEIYSPPYLFNGPRPTISSMDPEVGYNSSFTIDTPDADAITSVVMMNLGTVTHSFSNNQRFLPLSFSHVSSTQLSAVSPLNGNHAPPTYYMVFILNGGGVPSKAKFIRLGPTNTDVPPLPPVRVELASAPNPARHGSTVTYSLPREATVRLRLVDVTGRVVRDLVNGREPAGMHRVSWDGKDATGARVPTGRYWWMLNAGDEVARRSMVVLN